jgi:hypothetical protein
MPSKQFSQKVFTMSKIELEMNEPHPAAFNASAFIMTFNRNELAMWQESFSSCAIEGNRVGEICGETLRRLLAGEPVSDRYVMGLAMAMGHLKRNEETFHSRVSF